ncbi:Acyl-CoA thioesterase I [Methylophaga thiooxydans]|uniref:Acyl-CoA thioesterase I n=1 Tax=Methylophaga thiooxydans TaxID=392484 RepID=A0A0A0BEH9_9GAMM|nr:GDSL-type esterase/lipase family protein [Methylophaga thiooxydans]KGM06351.1 Acyl-CoA thioesterase I [Methylophaga thiooxydans]
MLTQSGFISYCVTLILIVSMTACSESDTAKLQALSQDAVILAFGDSLTYGTGANFDTESYPAVLSKLSGRQVINAGIPGEISREGLLRLDELLTLHQPDLVVLCHGGNDLIRKLDTELLKQNLIAMIEKVRGSGAEVVLLSVPKPGIFLKPSPVYKEVSSASQVLLENDVIADIESEAHLKSDPIHPNAAGYKRLAEAVHNLLLKHGALD